MKLKTHKKTYKRHPHSVSLLYAHLIISTKYRRPVLTQNVFTILRKSIEIKAKEIGLYLKAIEADGNHVHLLFCYPPTLSLSQIAQHIKGYSSYIIRRHHISSIKKQLWGKAFWSKNYFVVSCGGAPLDIIKAYIDNQQNPQKRPSPINATPSQNYNEKEKSGFAAYVRKAHNKKTLHPPPKGSGFAV